MTTPPTKAKRDINTTLARKAKKVLKHNGLRYFQKWANSRVKTALPTLYRELVAKGNALGRKIDRPLPPKKNNTKD